MFNTFLKIAFRNIRRNKLHSFINIAGLAVAFSVCILLFLVCYFQFSFDSFHKDKDQLFRVSLTSNTGQGDQQSTVMPVPLKSALEDEIPDIAHAVLVNIGRRENLSYNDRNIEMVVLRTDPEFFEVFNFPIVKGTTTPLEGIQDIALSERTANALFGSDNPIGKQIQIGPETAQQSYTVSALIKDCPRNSSISYDAVARIESNHNYADMANNWESSWSQLYVKLAPSSSKKAVEGKLIGITEKYYAARLEQLKTAHSATIKSQELLSMNLTNIDDVHFSGEKGTPIGLVYAIMGLGVFILVVACFNFVNLNIAQSFRRSRELGVRKTLGAYKRELILQLWGEAFLLYLIGFIIGAAIVFQLIPIFNSQFDAQIEFSSLLEPGFILIISGIFFVVTLIAGGLPALKMANFSLIEIIKGNVTAQKPGALRNGLIVGQFTISSLLICVSWIAGQQLNYLKELPIGFEKEQVVSIPVGEMNDGRKILSRLRNAFSQYPGILSVTGTGSNLGRGLDKTSSRTTIGTDYQQNHIEADWILTDFDYLKTLGIPLIEGRDFSPDIASDSINSVVVTESFIQEMGEPNPIGKYFGGDAVSGTRIIGVVNNFNAYSPAKKSLPIAMHISPKEHINYIFVKIRLDDHQQVMKVLEAEWAKHTDNAAFNASFLDENLQAWYEEETILTTIFGIASAIAIFLSCLGLFAISLLVIELRTKEIGIRKVMGASVSAIVRMVFIHFFKLIMISLLIALPLGWYAMHSWIENYAYRIQINPLTLFAIGLLVTVVALATVSYHSIKAAILNPVKSLRTE